MTSRKKEYQKKPVKTTGFELSDRQCSRPGCVQYVPKNNRFLCGRCYKECTDEVWPQVHYRSKY